MGNLPKDGHKPAVVFTKHFRGKFNPSLMDAMIKKNEEKEDFLFDDGPPKQYTKQSKQKVINSFWDFYEKLPLTSELPATVNFRDREYARLATLKALKSNRCDIHFCFEMYWQLSQDVFKRDTQHHCSRSVRYTT
jgi:hypothetical protein